MDDGVVPTGLAIFLALPSTPPSAPCWARIFRACGAGLAPPPARALALPTVRVLAPHAALASLRHRLCAFALPTVRLVNGAGSRFAYGAGFALPAALASLRLPAQALALPTVRVLAPPTVQVLAPPPALAWFASGALSFSTPLASSTAQALAPPPAQALASSTAQTLAPPPALALLAFIRTTQHPPNQKAANLSAGGLYPTL